MIVKFANDIAKQLGINLSKISFIDGEPIGCLDCHLLHLYSDSQMISTLIYQHELEDLQNEINSDVVAIKIRAALMQLQMLDIETLQKV
jgi:hypothetical protein